MSRIRRPSSILFLNPLILSLLVVSAVEVPASCDIGEGSPVDPSFVVTPFDVEGESDGLHCMER